MTKKQIEKYFDVEQKRTKEWAKLKAIGIYMLSELKCDKSEIKRIIGLSEVTFWRLNQAEVTPEMVKHFTKLVKNGLYPVNKIVGKKITEYK